VEKVEKAVERLEAVIASVAYLVGTVIIRLSNEFNERQTKSKMAGDLDDDNVVLGYKNKNKAM